MRRFLLTLTFLALPVILHAQETKKDEQSKSTNLRQYYSGKFGIYKASDGLNNGLLFGIDGITEFIHYDFFLSGAAELYLKQTFNIYNNAPPSGYAQAMILIPLHANVGFQLFSVGDADSRGYIGGGLGYYLYFYNVEYQEGGGIFNPLSNRSETKNGGNLFGTVFFRVLIGQIFLEPRVYFAAKEEDGLPGGYNYTVNPSGFAVTLGFQYH